ncbi:MAG: glycosyltransferase family 2 protein [Phycisphaerae bacterium]
MTVTVIIVTYNRPDCAKTCLDRLREQTRLPEQIIVVDGSPDDRTRSLCAEFSEVLYLRNEAGLGHMTRSRNIGLQQATGEIIAFLDDDSFAHGTWLDELLKPYSDPAVGAVGGRALRNQPDEDKQGVDQIGKLLPNGELTGNFAADPGKDLEVDHIIGCNMSWRKKVLDAIGGLREIYPGTEVCEETDIALRFRAAGHKIIFAHKAVVDHLGAPQAKGRRFDTRYTYYHFRNRVVLLVANFGFGSPLLRRYAFMASAQLPVAAARSVARAAWELARSLVTITAVVLGIVAGFAAAARLPRSEGRGPAAAKTPKPTSIGAGAPKP